MDVNAIKMVQTMASDPRKRLIIIKDETCVNGLVSLLSNKDDDIVSVVLETLQMLSKSAEEIKLLCYTPGLVKAVKGLMKRSEESHAVPIKAREFYKTLAKGHKDRMPLNDSSNKLENERENKHSLKQKSTHHAKAIILQIKGIANKCDADLCIKLIIEVKGVISITFNMETKRCVVRTKATVKPEALVKAVSNSQTFKAQQVIKYDDGKEVFQSFGLEEKNEEKENFPEPEYLPDDPESPVFDSKAVARTGPAETEESWFSAAASFLSSSFYW